MLISPSKTFPSYLLVKRWWGLKRGEASFYAAYIRGELVKESLRRGN